MVFLYRLLAVLLKYVSRLSSLRFNRLRLIVRKIQRPITILSVASVVPFKLGLIVAYFGRVNPKIDLINRSEP